MLRIDQATSSAVSGLPSALFHHKDTKKHEGHKEEKGA